MQLRSEIDEGLLFAGNGEPASGGVKPELLLGPAEQFPERGVVQERHWDQETPPLDVPDVDSDLPVWHVGARLTVVLVVMVVPTEKRLQLHGLFRVGNNGWQAKKTHDSTDISINLQALRARICSKRVMKVTASALLVGSPFNAESAESLGFVYIGEEKFPIRPTVCEMKRSTAGMSGGPTSSRVSHGFARLHGMDMCKFPCKLSGPCCLGEGGGESKPRAVRRK